MASRVNHQVLPANGVAREALREKGQFWTPPWVADAMVSYVARGPVSEVFDPAVGGGAFFAAAKRFAEIRASRITLRGTELFPDILNEARKSGLTNADLKLVEARDFVLDPPVGPLPAIVANPPYIRHHRIPTYQKVALRKFATQLTGSVVDGRAGLHIFFLLRALELLSENGRLAFILPADTCEGVFARPLWQWIARNYRLDAVVTFSSASTPFPGVDTNALVFLISRAEPEKTLRWVRCESRGPSLMEWIGREFPDPAPHGVRVESRSLSEALETGLSRAPVTNGLDNAVPLSRYARVLRGIATGANDFFFLSADRAKEIGIPHEYLIRAIGRTRDATQSVLARADIEELELSGRPTWLLNIQRTPFEDLPRSLRAYLKSGEQQGLHTRALISSRRPWYRMEKRVVPKFLFAYLGRRNARFIRNDAGVVPLTGFLCIYPTTDDPDTIDRLWAVLQHPDTVANLALVGKSYGGGAIKVEPRALETLPLPSHVLQATGLAP